MSDTVQLISEDEFRHLLDERTRVFRNSVNTLLEAGPDQWSRALISRLREQAHDTETFLDDFEARNNSRYTFFTELVASVRGFTNILLTVHHVGSRFPKYRVSFPSERGNEFAFEMNATRDFARTSLTVLSKTCLQEASQIGLTAPDNAVAVEGKPDEMQRHLPHDLDEGEVLNEHQVVGQIVAKYRQGRELFGPIVVKERIPISELKDWRFRGLDESHARELGAFFHGIQAKYDTFVNRTSLETDHPDLTRLRGHISLVLHLLELTTDLIHFYERHENDIRWEPAKARIAQLIDKSVVLDRAVNFCLYFATHVVELGLEVAELILPSFIPLDEMTLQIPEGVILHARPLSLLVKLANHHGTSLEMRIGEDSCDASSIMGMIMLAGNHTAVREVVFSGDARALADVKLLFDSGLGESGLSDLPKELAYLR